MTAVIRSVHLPTEVDAVQWLGDRDAFPQAWLSSGALQFNADGSLTVITGKGPADARLGDYVLLSDWDEYWPISEPKYLASYKAKS